MEGRAGARARDRDGRGARVMGWVWGAKAAITVAGWDTFRVTAREAAGGREPIAEREDQEGTK
jgi:hypothetical protein